jgi:hypothetical protein
MLLLGEGEGLIWEIAVRSDIDEFGDRLRWLFIGALNLPFPLLTGELFPKHHI